MSQDSPSYANLANLQLLETLYEQWSKDPESIDSSWKNFFDGMQFASLLPQALPARQDSLDLRISLLIHAYRTYGHLYARSNPLEEGAPPFPKELDLKNFGLSESDLSMEVPTCGFLEEKTAPLQQVVEGLQMTYCRTIGLEYMDLGSVEIEEWIQGEIEPFFPSRLTPDEKIEILQQINEAEGFERFLGLKYVGQKRFSLEGGETMIPMLQAILESGTEEGVGEVVIGMAHRGRLNVLANVMGKSYSYLFEEFEDYYVPDLLESSGDVKYHMGFQGTYTTKSGFEIPLTLSANPSHLESVDGVVVGGARALQEQCPKGERFRILPIQIHGDASISGQGVVYETMNMSKLKGYGTGGSIHIVVNNQIGFTTLPQDSRSTRYCTDIAKAYGAPVFHVNAENPEACVAAARMAIRIRQRFGCDVFLDLLCYRKYGHNEGDEPAFTQPLVYNQVRAKKGIWQIYREKLIGDGILTKEGAEKMEQNFKAKLEEILKTVQSKRPEASEIKTRKIGRDLPPLFAPVATAVDARTLVSLAEKMATPPTDVNVHPKVQRVLAERVAMLEKGKTETAIDWGLAENLAYATICTEGVHVRLSGQDVRRGTFAHRHALLVDQVTANHYFPLSNLSPNQAPCDVYNSPLSEYAVMGFEFGYSLMYPKSLVVWEAQYGDFANGGQIIIDQWFATSELKWGHATNLTFLLPHGYEGGGPEHSSGRVERFLQLAAEENMIVANVTTPAQLFHILRRQAIRPLKKPLTLFTPKMLLRFPLCRSRLSEFTEGGFEEILDDPSAPPSPKRILLVAGKIYYDLVQEREKRGASDALIRIEQFYPLHEEKLVEIIKRYPTATECIYVQEEHANAGAWSYLRPLLERVLEGVLPLAYGGRPEGASPAAGSPALHKLQHEILLKNLYGEEQ